MREPEALLRKPEGRPSGPEGNRLGEGFWTFDLVQERLVEAYGYLRRMPDREARWLRHTTMSLWQQINPLDGMTAVERRIWLRQREEEAPRLPGLTRAEVAAMEEALGWLDWVEPASRKVVGLAVAQLAGGRRTRIAWGSMASDPTLPGSADRQRKAYGRAVTAICHRLNAAPKLG